MGVFEFLMVLASVVIGLGITEILGGWANLLRARKSTRLYWVHLLLQIGVFLALLQQWWELWDLKSLDELSFFAVLTTLAPLILLFLIAHLLFPPRSETADLETYYYEQAPFLWGLVVLIALVGTLIPPLVFGYPILHPANLSGLVVIGLALLLALSGSRRIHAVFVPLVLLLVLLDTILANPAISTP